MTRIGTAVLGLGFALLAFMVESGASSQTVRFGQPLDAAETPIEIVKDQSPDSDDADVQGREIGFLELIW